MFANSDTVVSWNGLKIRLAIDDVWQADCAFVKARPEFFNAQPRNLFTEQGRVTGPTATRPISPRRTRG